jgi:uncharacterized protein
MKINFAGQELVLCASGMVFWPKHQLGIVSDMHLEKGSHFAKRGFFLPPYDSQETLQRLITICKKENLKRLIILGDCFHDSKGYDRLTDHAQSLFGELRAFNPIWIQGNHDREFVPENMVVYDQFTLENIIFQHEASPQGINEISGHYHPKVSVVHKGGFIQRDCFVTDGQKLILPAFGSYTGGLFIHDEPIKSLFTNIVHTYALGNNRIFHFPGRG